MGEIPVSKGEIGGLCFEWQAEIPLPPFGEGENLFADGSRVPKTLPLPYRQEPEFVRLEAGARAGFRQHDAGF
jgi:hypothetical protein